MKRLRELKLIFSYILIGAPGLKKGNLGKKNSRLSLASVHNLEKGGKEHDDDEEVRSRMKLHCQAMFCSGQRYGPFVQSMDRFCPCPGPNYPGKTPRSPPALSPLQ